MTRAQFLSAELKLHIKAPVQHLPFLDARFALNLAGFPTIGFLSPSSIMPPGRSMSGVSNATINSHDERTPLLEPISPVPTDITVEPPTYIEGALGRSTGILIEDEDTPLPRFQIFLLCLTRLVEPIAFFSIFPYITYMIERIGVEKEDVGFYTGLIESLFSATQMCVMILWGKASDRFGRKPCLVLSIFGAAVGTALFGTSTTIWQLILYRCIAGAFSGTMV